MNPLGQLPASQSTRYRLNTLDWQKILRFFLVQLIGLFISVSPMLLGMKYVWRGHDFTAAVVGLVGTLVEIARKFVSGDPAPPAPAP